MKALEKVLGLSRIFFVELKTGQNEGGPGLDKPQKGLPFHL